MTRAHGPSRGGIRDGIARVFRLPFRRASDVDSDATAELRAFVEARVEDLVRHGMSPRDARTEAQRRLGYSFPDAAQLLQRSARTRERRISIREFVDDVRQDVRYALRALRRDRTFTLFAVLVAGLGIGACVTVFSIVNHVLIRPLPTRDAHQLVWIANTGEGGLSAVTTQSSTVTDLREQSRTLRAVAAYSPFYEVDNTTLVGATENSRLTIVSVTGNFFETLGVSPMLGRSFTAEEGESFTGGVLLSHLAWQRRFASDPAIVGRKLTLDDAPVTVIGVLPPTFDFASMFAPGTRVDAFMPFPLTELTNGMGNTLALIGRLAPSATLAQAVSELPTLSRRISEAHPERNRFTASVVALQEHVSGRVHGALVILLLSVGVVMIIVCANLSHLLLARGSTRSKEVAVRLALGASRGRVTRQLLTERGVLALGGAVLGIAVAVGATRVLAGLGTFSIPLLDTVSVDASALGFAAVLTVAAGLGFGLAPSLSLPTSDVNAALKSSSRGATGARHGRWTRDALIVSEIALACVLLIAAGLLTRSFIKVLEVDPGFRPDMVASVRVDPGKEHIASADRFVAYVDGLLERTRAIPGVQHAGLVDRLPLGSNRQWGIRVQGMAYSSTNPAPLAFIRVISDGYVAAMGMKLVDGRDFTPEDNVSREGAILLNETLARTLFRGERAIGRMVEVGQPRRVIGIVGDVRHAALDAAAGNEMYIPYRQTGDFSAVNVVARTTMSPEAFTGALHDALAQLVPNLPAKDFTTLQQRVDHALSSRRFTMAMLNGFAMFAVLLALLGIHGVVSYNVNQRRQELGVRMALGASAGRLQLGIVRGTLGLAAIGMLLGTLASWALVRWMSSFLFGITATDPVTFALTLATLTAVAVVSGYLPARRVSRIDPIASLRSSA